jgi:transcriptional regulator with XRE-family HTH domain
MDWKPYFYDILGLRLRQARRSAGLTQRQVGERLGKPRSYVSECERGKRQIDLIEFVEFVLVYGKPTAWYLDYLLDAWGLTK